MRRCKQTAHSCYEAPNQAQTTPICSETMRKPSEGGSAAAEYHGRLERSTSRCDEGVRSFSSAAPRTVFHFVQSGCHQFGDPAECDRAKLFVRLAAQDCWRVDNRAGRISAAGQACWIRVARPGWEVPEWKANPSNRHHCHKQCSVVESDTALCFADLRMVQAATSPNSGFHTVNCVWCREGASPSHCHPTPHPTIALYQGNSILHLRVQTALGSLPLSLEQRAPLRCLLQASFGLI